MAYDTASADAHPSIADPARLEALGATGLLSAEFDASLDRWTRLAAGLIGAPTALFTLVDRDRQYFKSFVGLPEALAAERESPLSHSFCQHVVSTAGPFVVTDARADPRVRDNGAIDDHGVIAYAGHPVTTGDGQVLGALCVVDRDARQWTSDELRLLEDLVAGLTAEIELRSALARADRLEADLIRQARFDALTGLPNRRQLDDDLATAITRADPPILSLFDLDGFKAFNDTFGHPAGDALLVRLGEKLSLAVGEHGTAYRLGGDEFCVLAHAPATADAAAAALGEHGTNFSITNSHGRVQLGGAVTTPGQAMQIADEQLYGRKRSRSAVARQPANDMLLGALHERERDPKVHVHEVDALRARRGFSRSGP